MDFQTKAKLALLLKTIYSKSAGSDFRLPVCHSYPELTPTYLETVKMPVDLCTLMVLVEEQSACSAASLRAVAEKKAEETESTAAPVCADSATDTDTAGEAVAEKKLVTPAKSSTSRTSRPPLSKGDVLRYIKQIYDNSLTFNKGTQIMEVLAKHLKYFSVCLFDELFPAGSSEEAGGVLATAAPANEYTSNRLLRLLVVLTDVLDQYELRLLLQLLALLPNGTKAIGYADLLKTLLTEVARLNAFCSSAEEAEYSRLSLLDLLRVLRANQQTTGPSSENALISEFLSLSMPLAGEAALSGYGGIFNTLSCHLFERHTRGCELSCIWAVPQCLIYAQPPNKIGSNSWWPAMGLVCIQLRQALSADTVVGTDSTADSGVDPNATSTGLEYALEQRMKAMNHVNIARIPASTLSQLIKLVPRQGNYATGNRDNNYYAAITSLLADVKRRDIHFDHPPASFNEYSISVGAEAGGSGGSTAGTSSLVLVEYLNTHDFGWVKLDQCYPMCHDSSFPMTLLPPAPSPGSTTTPSKDSKDPSQIRMGCGERGIVEAREVAAWVDSTNPALFGDPRQYRAVFRGARHSARALKTAYIASIGAGADDTVTERAALEHHKLIHPMPESDADGTAQQQPPMHRQESEDDMIVTNSVYATDAVPVAGSEEDLVLETEDIYRSLVEDAGAGSADATAVQESMTALIRTNTGQECVPQLSSLAAAPSARLDPGWRDVVIGMRGVYSGFAKGGITLVYPTLGVTKGQRKPKPGSETKRKGDSNSLLRISGVGMRGGRQDSESCSSNSDSDSDSGSSSEDEDAVILDGGFTSAGANSRSGGKSGKSHAHSSSNMLAELGSGLTNKDPGALTKTEVLSLVCHGHFRTSHCPLPKLPTSVDATAAASAEASEVKPDAVPAPSAASTPAPVEGDSSSSGGDTASTVPFKQARALHYARLACQWMRARAPVDTDRDYYCRQAHSLSALRLQMQLSREAETRGTGTGEQVEGEVTAAVVDGSEEQGGMANTPEDLAHAQALLEASIVAARGRIETIQHVLIPNLAGCTTRQVFYGPECIMTPDPVNVAAEKAKAAASVDKKGGRDDEDDDDEEEEEQGGAAMDTSMGSATTSATAAAVEACQREPDGKPASTSAEIVDEEAVRVATKEMETRHAANTAAAAAITQTNLTFQECVIHTKKVDFTVDLFRREAATPEGRKAILKLQLARIQAQTSELQECISVSGASVNTFAASNSLINAHVAALGSQAAGGMRKREKGALLEEQPNKKTKNKSGTSSAAKTLLESSSGSGDSKSKSKKKKSKCRKNSDSTSADDGISPKMRTAMEAIEAVFGYRIPCLHPELQRSASKALQAGGGNAEGKGSDKKKKGKSDGSGGKSKTVSPKDKDKDKTTPKTKGTGKGKGKAAAADGEVEASPEAASHAGAEAEAETAGGGSVGTEGGSDSAPPSGVKRKLHQELGKEVEEDVSPAKKKATPSKKKAPSGSGEGCGGSTEEPKKARKKTEKSNKLSVVVTPAVGSTVATGPGVESYSLQMMRQQLLSSSGEPNTAGSGSGGGRPQAKVGLARQLLGSASAATTTAAAAAYAATGPVASVASATMTAVLRPSAGGLLSAGPTADTSYPNSPNCTDMPQ